MTNPSRSRDVFRLGVASVTALVGAGTLTAVGWFTGTAARQHQAAMAKDEHAQAVAAAKAARARWRYDKQLARRLRPVILKPRPTRTVVSTRYVHAATSPVTVGGGTFATPAVPAPAAPPAVVPAAAPAPPPPPPPPPPAPSTGSHHGG